MTKSELKDIIKECMDEEIWGHSPINNIEESITEDSCLILAENYFDYLYESAISEMKNFNYMIEDCNVITEGRVVEGIKKLIRKIIDWIKNKFIPFIKSIPSKITSLFSNIKSSDDKIINGSEDLNVIVLNSNLLSYFNNITSSLSNLLGEYDEDEFNKLFENLLPLLEMVYGEDNGGEPYETEKILDNLREAKLVIIAKVNINGEKKSKVIESLKRRYDENSKINAETIKAADKCCKLLTTYMNKLEEDDIVSGGESHYREFLQCSNKCFNIYTIISKICIDNLAKNLSYVKKL